MSPMKGVRAEATGAASRWSTRAIRPCAAIKPANFSHSDGGLTGGLGGGDASWSLSKAVIIHDFCFRPTQSCPKRMNVRKEKKKTQSTSIVTQPVLRLPPHFRHYTAR